MERLMLRVQAVQQAGLAAEVQLVH